jgi:hypothetical protein
MMTDETPFADLPAALVAEILEQTTAVGDYLLETFRQVKARRATQREALQEHGLVLHESDLAYPPLPTTCATDGSYAIERLLTADLAVASAVAVEGLAPPSEQRHWDQPRHLTFMAAEVHHTETSTVLSAIMQGSELLLATQAPHDLVMLDGTLTRPLIDFILALHHSAAARRLRCSEEFRARYLSYMEAYRSVLRAERSDRNVIALPKYSTRREIGRAMGWPGEHDDRGMLTLLLQAGELTRPIVLQPPESEWRLVTSGIDAELRDCVDEVAAEIVAALRRVHIFYYKPHEWLPALRVEAAHDITANPHRLAVVVQGLKHQCATASMLEPYPLYLADRTVKALARALPAFRQVTTQRISEQYEGEISEVFFAMHGYRSERGG